MKTWKQCGSWLCVAAVLLVACARERSRVVEKSDAQGEEGHDYRGMLERARTRQSSAQMMAALEHGIEQFQHDLARLPTNLYELVARGYLENIADPPPGYAYSYDPVHGNVNLTELPSASGVQVPAEATNENRARLIEVDLPPPQ